ncbi:N-acetyltransferase [Neorhizobium sp. JUb45]|uniref:GNAT family N-acetyltransferase n=1 Tax=unclassified Neorhizobium TaxID=2629175 RepID=UPI00104CBD36|nr:N-acetyltransferase [Neorhizobium sp. JUb45]TCR07316.1 putative acetyltransferase [Neorhizobium sp. JUb45]
MILRPEQPGDVAAIAAVTAEAFAGAPHSDGSEPAIIDRLRAAAALAVSLVAVDDAAVIGHIAFSRVRFSSGEPDWYALGPVSVLPKHQGRGVGGDLIRDGLQALKARGAAGCVLLGEPAYYTRFGFLSGAGLTTPGLPPEYLMALPLRGQVPSGILSFHAAFGVDSA